MVCKYDSLIFPPQRVTLLMRFSSAENLTHFLTLLKTFITGGRHVLVKHMQEHFINPSAQICSGFKNCYSGDVQVLVYLGIYNEWGERYKGRLNDVLIVSLMMVPCFLLHIEAVPMRQRVKHGSKNVLC